ncbi:MAG: PAC2 family protein [Candidatus Phosphoribacter sp.]
MPDLRSHPPLREPVLIAAFEGWNDAGEAASGAVAHLVRVWDADPIGQLDPEDYYDFQVNRPKVTIEDGRRRITWPTTRISVSTTTSFASDVVLVEGIEPSTRWRAYAAELLEVAQRLDVRMVVLLGAFLADVPHTRPIPVSLSSDDRGMQQRFGARASDYEGPTGIVGVFAEQAARAGIDTLACWAAVPHYAGGPPSPKAALALLARLESVFDVSIPTRDVAEEATSWEHTVDELAESDDEVSDYVASLEEASDTAELPEASGDAIALEFERYLRGRGEETQPPG